MTSSTVLGLMCVAKPDVIMKQQQFKVVKQYILSIFGNFSDLPDPAILNTNITMTSALTEAMFKHIMSGVIKLQVFFISSYSYKCDFSPFLILSSITSFS